MSTTRLITILAALFLAACSGGDNNGDNNNGDNNNGDNNGTNNGTTNGDNNGTTGSTNAATHGSTNGGMVMVDCESLDYAITCDKPQADANGYLGCSDYFGDITGVEAQCSTNPDVDVRMGPPCGEYEFYVGSCVYYNAALPDRCYVTHIGASSEDLVEDGRAFYENGGCSGEWISGP